MNEKARLGFRALGVILLAVLMAPIAMFSLDVQIEVSFRLREVRDAMLAYKASHPDEG